MKVLIGLTAVGTILLNFIFVGAIILGIGELLSYFFHGHGIFGGRCF